MIPAFLALIAWPVILKQIGAVDRTKAISNLKAVNFALIDFDNDYGRFPDDTTISAVRTRTLTTLPLGTKTSNDYFRQLTAAGNNNESIFWAKTATTPHKPDGNITGTHAVEKGECSYAYVAGLSTTDDYGTPIAMAPMISGTWKFDPMPYESQAVILRLDGSVTPARLNPSGEATIRGMNLFDPGQPYWHGKAPNLKWPE